MTDLRDWISSNISCPKTVGQAGTLPAVCNTSGGSPYLALINSYGDTLIDVPSTGGQFTQIGEYYLRASCAPCNDLDKTCGAQSYKLLIEARRISGKSVLLAKFGDFQDVFDSEAQALHPLPCPLD